MHFAGAINRDTTEYKYGQASFLRRRRNHRITCGDYIGYSPQSLLFTAFFAVNSGSLTAYEVKKDGEGANAEDCRGPGEFDSTSHFFKI